jgi:hypothetical protein
VSALEPSIIDASTRPDCDRVTVSDVNSTPPAGGRSANDTVADTAAADEVAVRGPVAPGAGIATSAISTVTVDPPEDDALSNRSVEPAGGVNEPTRASP